MSFIELLDEAKSNDLKRYIELLKNHDWTYVYSSDKRAYNAGEASLKEIRRLHDIVDQDSKIFNKYKPKSVKMKSPQEPSQSDKNKYVPSKEDIKRKADMEKKSKSVVSNVFADLLKKNKTY